MRVAFTIVLNGLNHFKHNNFFHNMKEMFDYWIIVEGVSMPNGSTSWCKNLSESFHKNYLSIDGTTEFLQDNRCDNVIVICRDKAPWLSKDEQVNAAIECIQRKTKECMLWQIDVDEQWTIDQIEEAELALKNNNGKTGCFLCNYYVGKNHIVTGQWGEGRYEPYRRLWDWKGERFETHEPPKLVGKNGPGLLLPQRFNHYAYYFEEDVKFKEAYYQGYEGLLERWKIVQNTKETMHVRKLLGSKTWWSNTDTYIKYVNAG